MIRIIYDRPLCRVTLRGHAHSGEPGKDLVCAGVSALACTLAANVQALEEQGKVTEVKLRLEPGDARFQCRPEDGFGKTVRLAFDAVCLGFALMSREYPGFVSYESRMG